MAEPKTKKTTASVTAFLDTVEDEGRRADAKALVKIMKTVTGEKAVMWGDAIVGFGEYQSSTGGWPLVAFSPRKAGLVLYVAASDPAVAPALAKLGKHKVSGSCLHVKRMVDVDGGVLADVIARADAMMRKKHGA